MKSKLRWAVLLIVSVVTFNQSVHAGTILIDESTGETIVTYGSPASHESPPISTYGTELEDVGMWVPQVTYRHPSIDLRDTNGHFDWRMGSLVFPDSILELEFNLINLGIEDTIEGDYALHLKHMVYDSETDTYPLMGMEEVTSDITNVYEKYKTLISHDYISSEKEILTYIVYSQISNPTNQITTLILKTEPYLLLPLVEAYLTNIVKEYDSKSLIDTVGIVFYKEDGTELEMVEGVDYEITYKEANPDTVTPEEDIQLYFEVRIISNSKTDGYEFQGYHEPMG